MTESYNSVQYHSYPYSLSSLERLATLATLFGMKPHSIRSARVLELGCASGNNIIPHALKYSKGEYIGIDTSNVQIEEGHKTIKALDLKNIQLKNISIEDIDDSFGRFDYIICHGVFSWVSRKVRDKILEISNKNLSKNGIVYISYNTLPGWNAVKTVRDMMLYHTSHINKDEEKSPQARALLEFIKDAVKDDDSAYSKSLLDEAKLLSSQPDWYLRHDHLESENNQFYFSEFMNEANLNNLQYLADSNFHTMYLGNMSQDISKKLGEINNIIRTEQYMDFIRNRRFRSTLLCHSDVKLNRAINNEDIKKFYLSLDVNPEVKEEKATQDQSVTFYFKNNKNRSIKADSDVLKSILYVFADNNFLKFDDVVKKVNKKFSDDKSKEIEIMLVNNAMKLAFQGYMDISLFGEVRNQKVNLNKPKLMNLCEYQIKNMQDWITNITTHTPIKLSIIEQLALKHMNGKNTKTQILDFLLSDIKKNKLSVNLDDKKIKDKDQEKKIVSAFIDDLLKRLQSHGLLV